MARYTARPTRGTPLSIWKTSEYLNVRTMPEQPGGINKVRVRFRKKMSPERRNAVLSRIAVALVDATKDNILSQQHGTWTPVQYGPRAGSPALIAWANDWEPVYMGQGHYVVRPREDHARAWYAHMQGMTIEARRKPFMVFGNGYGKLIKARVVKLPKRDPRPQRLELGEILHNELR
jgi:hypothetical protein